jgi:hypothetical protein
MCQISIPPKAEITNITKSGSYFKKMASGLEYQTG